MKVREKLKRAKRQLENQEKMIAGLERGNRYLHGVCERAQREIAEQQEAEKQSGYDPDGEHEPRTGGEACIIPCGL